MTMTFKPVPYITLFLLLGCPTPAPVPPTPDASDASSPPAVDAATPPLGDSSPVPGSSCGIACSNLSDLGCTEGKQTGCQITMQHAQDDRLIKSEAGPPLTCSCLAAAKDKVSARACGVHCP
jgi:hypothetical protein